MKKIFFSILISIFLQINLSAQNSWTQTSMDDIINDMQSNSSGEIFAEGGSVYRSTDGGLNWVLLDLGIPNPPSILSLGISENDFLFVGTFSGGVFRSTDNGSNWLKIDSTMGNVTDFAFNNSGTIFIASTNGVFKSTDVGDSWQQLSSYLTGQIEIDNNTGRLYATFNVSSYSTTIYVSTDDGNTWNPANNGLTNGSSTITLSINLQGHIFAGTMYNGVFRSTNGGNNWLSINYGMASNQYWIRDFAFGLVNQIFAVGNDVYFSTNNGDTWGLVNNGIEEDWSIPLIFVAGDPVIISWFGNYIPGVGYPSGLAHRSDFTTSSLPPVLISPFNHATEVGINPILKWNAASLPSTYRVQVAHDISFSQVVFDASEIPDTAIQILNLQQGLDYYWRVNESNDEGVSGWSNIWHFITTYPPLSPPSLIFPVNGATNVSNSPTLVWGFVPSIAYKVQIASDSNFTSIIYQDSIAADTSVQVMNLSYETKYYWRVQTIRSDSISNWSLPWYFTTTIVGINPEPDALPKVFRLGNNFPNPFNPSTIITYEIPQISLVTLKIYDILGREVATLVNEEKPAGSYEVQFIGNELTSGIYFYRLQAGSFVETKKMILLK